MQEHSRQMRNHLLLHLINFNCYCVERKKMGKKTSFKERGMPGCPPPSGLLHGALGSGCVLPLPPAPSVRLHSFAPLMRPPSRDEIRRLPVSPTQGTARTCETPVLTYTYTLPRVPGILYSWVISSLRAGSVFGCLCTLRGAWHRMGPNTCLLNE